MKNKKSALFVLGDSIAFQYGPSLKKFLEDQFIFFTKKGEKAAGKDLDNPVGANGGDSCRVLDFLKGEQSAHSLNYDYLLLNCGLHDVKRNPETREIQVNIGKYVKNLRAIIGLARNNKIRIIWMRTTMVVDKIHNTRMVNAFHRFNKDVLRYNGAADKVMRANNIPVIDLYSFTKTFGDEAFCDHVHYREDIRALQAAYIAGFLAGLRPGERSIKRGPIPPAKS